MDEGPAGSTRGGMSWGDGKGHGGRESELRPHSLRSLKGKADAGSGMERGRSLEESENASAVLSWLLGVFASLVQKRQISYP